MSWLETPHGKLLGLGVRELRSMAGAATHQHFKGGLYRLIGPITDTETGKLLRMPESMLVAWSYEHIFPHERKLFVRSELEFSGMVEWEEKVDCRLTEERQRLNRIYGGVALVRRFRPLERKWSVS